MRWTEGLAGIARDGRRIIGLGRGAPDRIVPQYPTWTLRVLVAHVAGIHARTAAICDTLADERPAAVVPPEGDPFDWAEASLEAMLGSLAAADPEAEVWTLVSDRRLSFWCRRMLIETGVHCWDAQTALEDVQSLPSLVASNGLDEFRELYLPRLGDVPTIELVATDLGRSWRFGGGRPTACVEGTASDLFLRLMSRPGAVLPAAWEQAVDALGSPADR
jgi:uncharacterized protein (TIGR03083 family)